jgi:predicted RNA-binding protein with PUA-like domain
MAQWLLKSEPADYAWGDLIADGETEWGGVRNHQAARSMRAMQVGEQAFFYRSLVRPAIVGVMTVSASWYPDPEDQRFCRVRLRPAYPLRNEVSLKVIRTDPRLTDLALVRQSRLSVMPISDEHWRILTAMSNHLADA